MKMTLKRFVGIPLVALCLILLLAPAQPLPAMEFGAYAGTLNEAGTTLLGLTLDSGFLVPMLKVETEAYMFIGNDRTGKVMTLGLKLRPALGSVAPYAVAVVGTEFQRLDLSAAKDRYFTFVGGGVVVKLAAVFFLRLDVRFQQHGKTRIDLPDTPKVNYSRFSAGILLRI